LVSYVYQLLFNWYFCIGFLFLAGSVTCISIVNVTRAFKRTNISSFLNIFNFFKEYVNFIFYRKQNLVKQNNNIAATRIFKQKSE